MTEVLLVRQEAQPLISMTSATVALVDDLALRQVDLDTTSVFATMDTQLCYQCVSDDKVRKLSHQG